MSSTETRFTIRDYEQLPEGFPCELIEGRFVKEPAPFFGHQRVITRLVHLLAGAVGTDRVAPSPIDVVIDDFSVLQPDVAVWTEAPERDARWVPTPALVIEVLSQSTASRDRDEKTHLYLAAGIAEVWLIEPETGVIEVHTVHGVRTFAADERVTSAIVPEFTTSGAELTH
jgi:Uma2 family endonuclease